MSVMQAQENEERFERVSSFPRFGLFDDVTDAQAELLYLLSYEGASRRNSPSLHTVEGLRSLVLERLPREAVLISPQEYQLIMTLLSDGGETQLNNGYLLRGAESCARRLWCTIRREGDTLTASLPSRLSVRLADLLESEAAEEMRDRLSAIHMGIMNALNMYGAIIADSALSILFMASIRPGMTSDPVLCERMLKATYPYVCSRRGQLVLVHPGLADPQSVAEKAVDIDLGQLVRPSVEGYPQMVLSSGEQAAALSLYGLLTNALRPEYYPQSSTEDLRILMKQGVPLKDLEEVLASQLAVQPTSAMRSALRLMQSHTPTWLIHNPGRLH